jgi:hypothetical protein
MGFLKKMFRSKAAVSQLPSGSLTVNRDGKLITATVSSTYPIELQRAIGNMALELLRDAHTAQMPVAEITINFASLRLTARELRGGAIVFMFPQTTSSSMSS